MATKINVGALTLNPKEIDNFASIIIEKVLNNPQLSALHNIQSGVNVKEQIVFATLLGKTGIKDTTCARPNSGATTVLTQKYWDPKAVGDTLINCQKELDALFKAYYSKVQSVKELTNIEMTDEEAFLITLVLESAVQSVSRYVWLGDTAVAVSGGAAAGLIAAGDVKFYDAVDGLWKQIFADANIPLVTITENAAATKAAQLTLGTSFAYDLFNAMWAKADSRLRGYTTSPLLMMVSREIFDNYENYLIDKGIAYNIELAMGGLPALRFKNAQVVNMETVWDVRNRADFELTNAGLQYYLPNRALLTVKENIPVASLNELPEFSADGTITQPGTFEIESFWEQIARQNYLSYAYTLDAKHLESYMSVAAY